MTIDMEENIFRVFRDNDDGTKAVGSIRADYRQISNMTKKIFVTV